MFKVFYDELAIEIEDEGRKEFSSLADLLATLSGLVANNTRIYNAVLKLARAEARKALKKSKKRGK